MRPNDLCTKADISMQVQNVLKIKHLTMRILELNCPYNLAFEPYKQVIDLVLLQCNFMILETMTTKLKGVVGVDSVDALMAKMMLTCYGHALKELLEVMLDWSE